MLVNHEINFLSLAMLWLDNICQIKIKILQYPIQKFLPTKQDSKRAIGLRGQQPTHKPLAGSGRHPLNGRAADDGEYPPAIPPLSTSHREGEGQPDARSPPDQLLRTALPFPDPSRHHQILRARARGEISPEKWTSPVLSNTSTRCSPQVHTLPLESNRCFLARTGTLLVMLCCGNALVSAVLLFGAPRVTICFWVSPWPAEASLSGVEPLMQKIQSEIRRVDASILAAVRQQVWPCYPTFCVMQWCYL